MISKENLAKLYDAVLANEQLTTKMLNGFGFNSKDLNDLIERGSIERVKRGLYSLKNIDELYYYGKDLIGNKEFDKASFCFERCHELDPTHRGTCFQLFIRSIQKKDYERAFELFDNLLGSDNEYYQIDAKLYLYLLSTITEVPERYVEISKNLKLKDLLIPSTDKRYEDIPKQNMIRSDIYNGKLPYALKQLNDLTNKRGSSSVQDVITKKLLYQAISKQNEKKANIYNLINEDRYDEVVNILEEEQKIHDLNKLDSCILKLAKQIIEIQKTYLVPSCNCEETNNMFEAINNCNYSLALKLCNKYNEDYNISNDRSSIALMLEKINALIGSLSIVDQLDDSEIFNSDLFKIDNDVVFSEIVSYLLNNEVDKAFDILGSYMESIGKSEYQFLIVDLIKISLLEKDFNFIKPKNALDMLDNDKVSFDASSYLQDFYVALSLNKFDEARIYLDIISSGNKLNKNNIPIDKLYQVLDLSSKVASKESNNSFEDDSKKIVDTSNHQHTSINTTRSEDKDTKSTPLFREKSNNSNSNSNTSSSDNRNGRESEEEFVSKKHDELLENKGIILIRTLKDDKIDRIVDIANQYPDMIAFIIGQGKNKKVVLKRKYLRDNFLDVKSLFKIGDQAFKNKKYNECIDAYLQILEFFDEPKSFVYARLGMSYLKLKQKNDAVDYLTVATDVASKNDIDRDYSDLIYRLTNPYDKDQIKPNVKMKKEEFNYDEGDNSHGIENFDEINSYIINSGLDVESACEQINLTPEQTDIIKLMYAKEYYAQGYFEKGDLFLKSFERSQHKTKKSMELFREIMKNKKFYQNREVEQPKALSLSLKPRK